MKETSMEQVQVQGSVPAAQLLRTLADEVEHLEVNLGGRTVQVAPGVTLSLQLEGGAEGEVSAIIARLTVPHHRGERIALENEFAHPGG
jgi:hypothetical protein